MPVIEDGKWYERRDGKIVQAKPSPYSKDLMKQFNSDGSPCPCPKPLRDAAVVFAANGRHNYGGPDFPSDLLREVPDPTKKLKLRVGGKYLSRSGHEVTITRRNEDCTTYEYSGEIDHVNRSWTVDGFHTVGKEKPYDLVAEITPALNLKVGDRCLTRGGREIVLSANVKPVNPDYAFVGSNYYYYNKDGRLFTGQDNPNDIVSVLPPLNAFSISPTNYYRTRDGRKAYVAVGPVAMPADYEWPQVFYGHIEDGDEVESACWISEGTVPNPYSDDALGDLVAHWHPATLTDPLTGKTYRVAEEVTA
jgi:hypothetical protein